MGIAVHAGLPITGPAHQFVRGEKGSVVQAAFHMIVVADSEVSRQVHRCVGVDAASLDRNVVAVGVPGVLREVKLDDLMLWTAYQLIAGALPDLMDRMLDPSQLTLVNRVLLCNFDRIDAIHHVRTRRSGVTRYIEIGVGFSADRRIGEIDAINQSLRKELEAQIPDAKVTLVALAVPV